MSLTGVVEYLKTLLMSLVRRRRDKVVLRNGRDYRLEVSDLQVELIHRSSGEIRRMPWNEVTAVFVLALDKMPTGAISFVLHRGDEVLEIPWDTEGTKALAAKMQTALPGFDKEALIGSTTMVHGLKELWRRKRLSSRPFVIGRERR